MVKPAVTVNLGGLQINFKVFLAKHTVCLRRGEHMKVRYHIVIYHMAIASAGRMSVPEVY